MMSKFDGYYVVQVPKLCYGYSNTTILTMYKAIRNKTTCVTGLKC